MEFGKSVIVWGRVCILVLLTTCACSGGCFSLQFGSPLQMLNGLSGIAALRSESIEISQEFSIGFNERIWQHLIPYGYGENASFVLLVAFFGLVLVGFELIRRGIHKSASKAFRKVWVYLVLSLVPCLDAHLSTAEIIPGYMIFRY